MQFNGTIPRSRLLTRSSSFGSFGGLVGINYDPKDGTFVAVPAFISGIEGMWLQDMKVKGL